MTWIFDSYVILCYPEKKTERMTGGREPLNHCSGIHDSKSFLLYASEQFSSLQVCPAMLEDLPLQGQEHLNMSATEAAAIWEIIYLLGHPGTILDFYFMNLMFWLTSVLSAWVATKDWYLFAFQYNGQIQMDFHCF